MILVGWWTRSDLVVHGSWNASLGELELSAPRHRRCRI